MPSRIPALGENRGKTGGRPGGAKHRKFASSNSRVLTEAEIERLMAAARKGSRYGHQSMGADHLYEYGAANPFTVTIPPDERDEALPEKLKAELPGIMQWMIDGCVDWQERGLAPPEVVTTATAAYLEAEDALAAWIEEAGQRDPNAWEKSSDLFASWAAWATKAGEYVGPMKRFLGVFETKGFTYERRRDGRGYRGLRLTQGYPESAGWGRS